MKTQTVRGRLLASTMIGGAALMALSSAPAYAQDGPTQVEAIVVTGSRIARQDYIANSPVATVSEERIEATGTVNVEAILNTLPQVVPGFSANSNNPADGTATVDLRGLGPQRTLVLLNGHRMTPATKAFSSPDLNTIPASLIERVEVVTGGASAVYGSDALAGVVNFIMKDDFQGLEFQTQYGMSSRGDGETFTLNALMGANFDGGRGNLTAFAGYYDRDGVLSTERDWAAVATSANGSLTGLRGRFDNVALNPFTSQPTVAGCASSASSPNITFRNNGTTAFGFCNDPIAGDPDSIITDRYNFAPTNYLSTPAERLNLAFLGNYDITDNVGLRMEAFYTDSRNANQLAPTPLTAALIPFDNIFVTPSIAAVLAGRPNPTADAVYRRRMADVGARLQTHNNKTFDFTTGLDWDMGSGWNADATYTYGRSEFTDTTFNDISRSRFAAATEGLSDGAVAPTVGNPNGSCSAATLAIFPDCVPYNPFGDGARPQAALDFIRQNFTDNTIFERHTFNANLTGSVMTLPAGDVAVALGFERREDSFSFNPDAAHAAGDIFGFNQERAVTGYYAVTEWYGEALVPLFRDVPFGQYVGLELGVRYSDYTSIGPVRSYKFGGEWQFNDDLRLRGMYQRASRAPNLFELFQAGDQGFPPMTDPCSTVIVTNGNPNNGPGTALGDPAVRAFCTAQMGFDPVTAGYVQPNSQIESFFYGNPDLSEEVSDTYTAGLVWSPSFIDNLDITLDWYDISVEDYIAPLAGGATGTMQACFASLNAAGPECFNSNIGALVYRDATSELKVRTYNVNVSQLETDGVDLTVNYRAPMGWLAGDSGFFGDTLRMNLMVNFLGSYVLDGIDYKGTIGAYNLNIGLPDWKANLSLGYDFGPVEVNWTSMFVPSMADQGDIFEGAGSYPGVDSYTIHELQGRWAINDTVEIYGGIRNLFDQDPHLITNAPDGNTDPNLYDVLGRYFYIGGRLRY
ncbi:TonB-dependent receptor [Brevundimonas sp. 2R-24]|uniref:TonB-dependent receptor n=1 Tax=Peiella sedimenti TaxID=3061083 RepID=A0ABT8SM83_9CAUL|nr:TonB-dependent receptor [Caulobacteraceae bacterium XZ-24]